MGASLNDFGDGPFDDDEEENRVASAGEPAAKVKKNVPTGHARRTQWAVVGHETYRGCVSTIKTLPPGVYHVEQDPSGIFYQRRDVHADDLIRFSEDVASKVLAEIEGFWTQGTNFRKYGFLHRRGYLFYGPQGSGKSSIVQQISRDIIDAGGIVFLCGHPQMLSNGLKDFRMVEPDRPIVCVFEDIDATVKNFGESNLLSLLDGENQVDRVLNIATTNYPELLDKRIVARPRRFDRVVKIDMPSEQTRLEYLTRKFKIVSNGIDVTQWVEATEGFSLAALAELVISVECLGNDFDSSVAILKNNMIKKVSSSEFNEGKVGFGA